MIVLLVMQLSVLQDSRRHIAQTDRKTARLLQRSEPVLDASRPLLREARGASGALRASRDELLAALRGLPATQRAVEAIAAASLPVLRNLDGVDLRFVLGQALRATRALTEHGRLKTLIESATAVLGVVRQRDLLARAGAALDVAPRAEALLRETLRVQRNTLAVQRRTLQAQLDALAVQRESLRHIESIDRKTGGELPGGGG
jgi:hypothetical protein